MENSSKPTNNAHPQALPDCPKLNEHKKQPRSQKKAKRKEIFYPPLSEQVLELLTTNEAAFYLRLQPQTLRKQHCIGKCRITPIKLNGRLLWRKIHIESLLKAE